MKEHRIAIGAILLLVLALVGCGPQAMPTAAPLPPAASPEAPTAGAEAALTVLGAAFTLADLQAMEQVEVEAEGQVRTGVRLLNLLAAAGVPDVERITLVGRDGYAADVAVADLDEQSLVAYADGGLLDTVIPGQGRGAWVRDIVTIQAGSAAAPAATATPEPTPSPAADAVFTANGKAFTMADLKAMEQVEIDVEDKHYTGVRLLDVLAQAGITAGSIRLVASDAYEGQLALDVLDESSLLAYNDEGGVNTVLPGYDKGSWVKYVVLIEPLGAPQSAGPAPTVRPLTGETVTVVDSLGNAVLIPQDVNSVASMRSGITEIICALGQVDRIIAVDEMVKDGTSYGAMITAAYPQLMALTAPYAGHDLSVEEMLRLGPDVVLHGGYGRIKQAEALKKQAPGLPVVIAHFETIEQYMDDIRIVAQCVDAEDRAEEVIAYLQGQLDFVASRVGDVPEGEKVRVFYGGHEIDHVYTPDTFEHAQIILAGGVNVAQELSGWLPDVSPEQLLIWDPEVIVVLNGADVASMLSDDRVGAVSAIKNKRVYALPEAGWDFSSPRALFAIQWLATKLYPERFADVDIEAAADEFYQSVFAVDYTGPALAE